MPLISGSIPSLINGVSQQPATLRMPTQGEVQENGLSHITRGLEKRPATEHVAEITNVSSINSNDVFIHTIRRSEDEAYAFIVKGGVKDSSGTVTNDTQVKLIDLTGFATGTAGSEVYLQPDVVPTSGTGTGYSGGNVTGNGTLNADVNKYLSIISGTTFNPNMLSSTTVADFSFILNKEEKVKKKTGTNDHHPTRQYESLGYVKIGDYDGHYKILVTQYDVDSDGEINRKLPVYQYEVEYDTPQNNTESISSAGGSATPANTVTINNQAAVVVNNIAESLYEGVDNTVKVYLRETSGASRVFISTSSTTTNIADAYTGNVGVRDKGVVTTRYRHQASVNADGETVWGSWTTVTPDGTNSNVGLKAIQQHRPSSGVGSATTWTTEYTHGESLFYMSADYNETNSYPFDLEASDGRGDTNMVAINGSDEVPNFGMLPGSKIYTGFVAKVSGDRNTGQDDYYVKWNGSVWKESFRPKYSQIPKKYARNALDNTTLPVQLFKAFDASNNIYFVLKPVDYPERLVGDNTINPFPSFANYDEDDFPNGLFTINDIFFHRNRLGFISDENVILSETAEYFNYFATTVLSILDTAVIDVAVSNNQVAILKSAIPFQESLVLFSDLQQFKLTSDEFLTPTSVTVDVATNFEVSTDTKPVAAGKTIFFPFQRGAFSGIREYFIDIASQTNDANEITSHVPDYIEGTVKKLAVSSNEEVLCCIGDTDRKELIVYKYYYTDQEKLQSSWSKWRFDAEIIDMEFIGSVGFMLFRRGTKIYLEKLNLSVDNATAIMDDKVGVRLDRRVKLEWDGVSAVPALSDYYSDIQHDKVGTTVRAKGILQSDGVTYSSQFGKKIRIDGVDVAPRIGQTFTSAHDANNTYTVVDVGTLSGDTIEIEITPSVAPEPSIDQGGPIPNDTILTFTERNPVYVCETGEVILASQVTGVLQNGTTYSKSNDNSTPVIFAGIPYDFKYQFSEQFVKSGETSINSGRLQMRNFEISYDRTGFFEVEVSPKPYDNRLRKIFTRTFTGRRIGSLFLGKQELDTGVFRVPVYVNSKDVKITVSSDSWLPLSLQSADYEAFQVLRNQRI